MTAKLTLTLCVAASASLMATGALAGGGVEGNAKRLTAELTGAAEVPGPGDADGKGKAILELHAAQDKLCYKLKVEGIEAATMAHIHVGAAGTAGAPVLNLDAPADGSSANCKQIAPDLKEGLMKKASEYYVNVHNAAHPAGAVRGQIK